MRAAAIAIVLLLTTLVHAGEKRTVVLLPFAGPSGAEGETVAEAARDLVAAAISHPGGPRLVDRHALEQVLAEQELQARTSPEAVRIGKLLRATYAVKGTVAREGKGWHIVLVLLTVPEGAVLGTVDESGPPADAAAAAAKKLAGLLAGTEPPAGLREDPKALASLHYLRGIGYLRAGLSLEAIGELLEAKRLAVRFPETRYWMARAYLDAGLPEHARIEAMAFLAEVPDHSLAKEAGGIVDAAGKAGPRSSPEIRPPASSEEPAVPSDEDPLDRLRRELMSPSVADRHAAAQRAASKLPRDAKQDGGPVLPILLEVARTGEPAASLNALRVLLQANRPEGLSLVTERVVDESLSPAYRTEMLRPLQSSMLARDPDLQSALFTLIVHENRSLRQMVHYMLRSHPQPEVPDAARKEALAALLARRFPDDASRLSWMVDWEEVPDALEFSWILLASESGAERLTGFIILSRVNPRTAAKEAWVLLEDEHTWVRDAGLRAVGKHADPEEGFLRLLDRWSRVVKPIENINLRTQRDNAVRYALRDLGRRAFDLRSYFGGAPVLPQVREGPEAFRRWYDSWSVRARNYEEALKQWTAAEGEDRDRLLVEMAAAGHPEVLRHITPKKLGPAELEALTAFAAAVGYEGKDPPAAGADRRAIGAFLNRIWKWLTGPACRW